MHQALHPAFANDLPYVAAIVELAEGVRMATRLLDCDPLSLALDQPVELEFREFAAGDFLPCFRLVSPDASGDRSPATFDS